MTIKQTIQPYQFYILIVFTQVSVCIVLHAVPRVIYKYTIGYSCKNVVRISYLSRISYC